MWVLWFDYKLSCGIVQWFLVNVRCMLVFVSWWCCCHLFGLLLSTVIQGIPWPRGIFVCTVPGMWTVSACLVPLLPCTHTCWRCNSCDLFVLLVFDVRKVTLHDWQLVCLLCWVIVCFDLALKAKLGTMLCVVGASNCVLCCLVLLVVVLLWCLLVALLLVVCPARPCCTPPCMLSISVLFSSLSLPQCHVLSVCLRYCDVHWSSNLIILNPSCGFMNETLRSGSGSRCVCCGM